MAHYYRIKGGIRMIRVASTERSPPNKELGDGVRVTWIGQGGKVEGE